MAWARARSRVLMNAGPNATTYILPVELYPTKLRATGHGFAAAAGKLGAKAGHLLAHTTSAEVMAREYGRASSDAVGYAAILFA